MGLFDDLRKAKNALSRIGNAVNAAERERERADAEKASQEAAGKAAGRFVAVTFAELPQTLEAFKALPQAAQATPFDTAAMTVVALQMYPKDRELCYAMLGCLKGPAGLSPAEKQFIRDRMMDQAYVPRSYFGGAVPGNDYEPARPYAVTVSENPYSYENQGYAKLFLQSGGADSPRAVTLRLAKDGRWYLWEQFLLVGIRPPESTNPWA